MQSEEGAVDKGLARQVRFALESADLSAFADLLHPGVQWGPPGHPAPPCRNREQVLAWYRRGHDSGARAKVTEVVVVGDHLLVGLVVQGTGEARQRGGQATRWQVLTVRDGRTARIVGFEQRSEAAAWAGLTADPEPPA